MQTFPALALYLAAILTFCGAALHFACVFWGANGFRFLGAGKSMVAMSEKGLWYPNLMAIQLDWHSAYSAFMPTVLRAQLPNSHSPHFCLPVLPRFYWRVV
ncbi:hypothetical protein EC844_10933 [Acinetobacter calcoaceticus]|uniref:Uncharacterized protein n=1 Tax=Acinetobacter calcoaceticus TaxID=471 RepID=A0A4R1XSC8_ACICA|nr:hypothetical protein EC844_10933 [Acinetobacter calcoaceticus]